MTLVSDQLTLIRARLHDNESIWSQAELLRFFNDGYREILAKSQAFSRLLPLDVPGRHSYGVSYAWEAMRHTSGGTWWMPLLAGYAGTRQATAQWEVEHLDGVTPTASLTGLTMQWERPYIDSTDRHFQFGLPLDHERVRRLEWQNRVLKPVAVREFDELDDGWMRRVGQPNWWTVGVGQVRSVEVYEILVEYLQAYALLQAEAGVPRYLSGERTYATEVEHAAANAYAYSSQADQEALTVPGMAFVPATAYCHSWEREEAYLTAPLYNFAINLTMNFPGLEYVVVHPWEYAEAGGPTLPSDVTPASTASVTLPSELENLAAWYRKGLGMTVDGDLVSQWDDQSGHGRHLVQATGASQPTLLGDGSLRFNGKTMKVTGGFTFAQPETVYLLVKQVSWTSGNILCDGLTNSRLLVAQGPSTPALRMYGGTFLGDSGNAAPLDQYVLVCGVYDSTNSVFRVNHSYIANGNAGVISAGGFTLGSAADGTLGAEFDVQEVALFAGAHDDETYGLMFDYFMSVLGTSDVKRGMFAWEAYPGEAYESRVLLSDTTPALTGMGARFTDAPTDKTDGFYVYAWEGDMLNGDTVGTETTPTYHSMFPWELEYGGETLTFSVGGVRGIVSPDRQYVPMVSEAAPAALLGALRDWRSSEDNLMALETVVPPVDLGLTDAPVLIPEPFTKYLRYYVWSRAFGREGEGQRLDLSQHYEHRFQRGVNLLKRFGDVAHMDRVYRREDERISMNRPPLVRLPATFERIW